MITNTIRARLVFSFKGEDIALESTIDLDHCRSGAEAETAPDFHLWLAREANIDPYSYQYEVLEMEEIAFDRPTGLVAQCCAQGRFDWVAFDRLRREARDPDGALKRAMPATHRAGRAEGE